MATVLIADDDRGIRKVVRSVLEDAEYAVCEARDGVEAFAALRDSPVPMVALIDLHMPKMNGLTLMKLVAKDKEMAHRHVFVVFSADTLSLPVVRALRSAAVVTSLAKPFELDALLRAVEAAEAVLTGQAAAPVQVTSGCEGNGKRRTGMSAPHLKPSTATRR